MPWPTAADKQPYARRHTGFNPRHRRRYHLERCFVTETAQTRSRRASLAGLILQLIAFGSLLAISFATRSQAMYALAWLVLGGVPIWFVTLLIFRQRELAALEALDLEELRREKEASGGGEALFDEEGGMGLGFRVAEARLHWMQRWLLPGFSLATAVYLAAAGVYFWRVLISVGLRINSGPWPEFAQVPVAMVIVAIFMVGTVLFSRYASGMGRVSEWQLLRGCGSYMLGNALAMMALLIALGVQQYAKQPAWEHTLAFIIPAFMVVLAVETLINFVLDIYRPRAPGTEPRAAFDSRLLGLIAEPGGIASSIAEAINYQFGFQVSQTWFYKLLERAALPLVVIGGLVLWGLTSIIIVQPYEHVIVERFGRQLNAADPLGPGLHFKLPWPIDVARTYNTGKLHEVHVGYDIYDAQIKYADEDAGRDRDILLWTDTLHFGLKHFDFLICPLRQNTDQPEAEIIPAGFVSGEQRVDKQPVHLLRMDVAVQYRLVPERLAQITQVMANPQRLLLDIAWEEIGRINAYSTADYLMGQGISELAKSCASASTNASRTSALRSSTSA